MFNDIFLKFTFTNIKFYFLNFNNIQYFLFFIIFKQSILEWKQK